MQNSTPQFDAAVDAGSVTILRPNLRIGWSGQAPDVPQDGAGLRIVDTFAGRTVASGWGTTSDSQSPWQIRGAVASNFAVASNAGSMAMITRGESSYTFMNGRTFIDSRMRFRTRMNTNLTVTAGQIDQIFVSSGACFRMSTTDPVSSHYEIHLAAIGASSEVWLRVYRRLPSTGIYEILAQTRIEELTHVNTNVYWIDAECAGDILRAKAWLQTDPEPDDYQVSYTGDTALAGVAGYCGMHSWTGKNTTMTLPYSTFYVELTVTDLRVLSDLSELQGPGFEVSHSLDDGMPDGVTMSAGSDPTGSMSSDLTGVGLWDARRTFSPFNADSPYATYPRDIAGVQLEHGVQTAIGPERIRLFTGQMIDLPISGREASMEAISKTRTTLMKFVDLPIVNGDQTGLNASWPVSYVLNACGLPLSPVPDPRGLVWWAPMHGSTHTFYPNQPNLVSTHTYTAIGTATKVVRPRFRTDAPYLMGLDVGLDSSGKGTKYEVKSIETGSLNTFNRNNTQGRIEFVMRAPTTTGGTDRWFEFMIWNNYGVQPRIQVSITNARQLAFIIEDGSGATTASSRSFNTGIFLPNDTAWHSVGFYWNVAGNELRVRLDGSETVIIPSPAFNVSNMALVDAFMPGYPLMRASAPIAEFRWWNGPFSNPSVYGWNDYVTNTVIGSTVASEDWEDTTYAFTWTGTWTRTNTRARAGTWSIRSAAIGNSATSDLMITVPGGSSTMSFWYWTSSEAGYDKLQVVVNGVVLNEQSGQSEVWSQITVNVKGVTTVTLRYTKDAALAANDDAVYVDDVVFTGAANTPVSTWTTRAVVRPLDLELRVLASEGPEEAWKILASYAQATLSAMRTDEYDRLNILPPSYFSEPTQMTVVDTISTDLNAQDPDVVIDPSKVRNSIRVDFQETRIDQANSFVLAVKTAIEVPPGLSTQTFSFDAPTVSIDPVMQQYTAVSTAIDTMFTVNSQPDGAGTYLAPGQVTARVLSWNSRTITIQFTNFTASVYYISNNYGTNMPYLGVSGKRLAISSASASVSDIRGVRGERTLTVDSPVIQTRTEAQNLAGMILGKTVKPSPQVTITVFGDPRRQPGDLVSLVDAQGTQIMGLWRIMSINHTKSGAAFTQKISLVSVGTPALWDTAGVGWDDGTWSN